MDSKLAEIEWLLSLPIENDAKAALIRKILTDIKVNVAKTHYDSLIDKQTGLLNKNSLKKMFKISYLSLLNDTSQRLSEHFPNGE